MSITIKEGVRFKQEMVNLKTLREDITPGNQGFKSRFSTVAGVLQRINQSEEWMKNNHKRSQEFMNCVITGAGALDNIIIVPIDLVLKGLVRKSKQMSNIPKEIWEETIKTVEEDMNGGTEYYVIDGQNRLVNAIKGFYEDVFPLGDKVITVEDNDEEYFLNGKKYSELPEKYQEYIDEIRLRVLIAEKGDIDSFVDSLIAKNEGLPWEEWMKFVTKHWYTVYRKRISNVTSNPQVKALLNKIKDKTYSYNKNGHDLMISELIIWMDTKKQVNKTKQHKAYFIGLETTTEKMFSDLEKYIREFHKGYMNHNTIQNVEFRNYIMFRYAMDNRNEFKTISIPHFKIEMPVDFVNQYRLFNEALRDVVEGRITRVIEGKSSTTKVAGYYYWACSEIGNDFLTTRLKLLGQKFIDQTTELVREGIVKKLKDDMPMPSLGAIWDNNPKELSTGSKLRPSEVTSQLMDRGHKIAKNNGGTNDIDNLAVHEKSHNRSIKDTNII